MSKHNRKLYFVVLCESGYFLVSKPDKGERVVFSGTWSQCAHYINPVLF